MNNEIIVYITGIVVVVISIGKSIFQLLLALGKPNGCAAYGGKCEILPKNLRIMSLIGIGIFVLASISVLARSGIIPALKDSIFSIITTWIFTFYTTLMILVNALSKSKIEQRIMTPLSLILTICFLIILITA